MVYEGDITINSHKIRIAMNLVFKRDSLQGLYSYTNSTSDIRLQGKLSDGGQNIELYEVRKDGEFGERFIGTFMTYDPRKHYIGNDYECDIVVGKWHDPKNQKEYAVYLSKKNEGRANLSHIYRTSTGWIKDDETINKAVFKFRAALREGDKNMAASMIKYPIRVGVDDRRKTIKNKSQFIKFYNKIFGQDYVNKILNARGRYLFLDAYDNVALGDGDVWFDCEGVIIALNNKVR